RRELARPPVVRPEWKLVLARRQVDEQARVGVVAPGAADVVGLLVDGEVDPRALELLGHEEAADAGTGDYNPKLRHSKVQLSIERSACQRASTRISSSIFGTSGRDRAL